MVERSEIENRDDPYTADDYIPTPKNIHADFLHSFDQNEHYNYNEKEEEKKKEPQNEDNLSSKEQDEQNKEKMSKELHNLVKYLTRKVSKRNLQIKSSESFKINNIWEM